jgi:glucose-6-phosphate dehydrogenase assembly protein OpcA
MIITLPNTTTGEINNELVRLRMEGGVVTLGRVMTLVVDATCCDAEKAIEAANHASREHPCRVVVLAKSGAKKARLDAEIRVGGDAGASEVVVLRPSGEMLKHADTLVIPLLLPDAPIVAWWPGGVTKAPALTALGAMATRRITDARESDDPKKALLALADGYAPGDTDLAWARVTRWRALLAAALQQAGSPAVTHVRIHGDLDSPSILLLGAWLRSALGCEFEATYDKDAKGLVSVVLETPDGEISIKRRDGKNATFSQPGLPDHVIALARRTLQDCLSEDLRRLDADEVYGEALIGLAGTLRA